MGILAQRFAAADELRNDTGWLNRDDGEDGPSNSPSGVRVTQRAALGLSTFWRCVDLISHAVSIAPKDVVLKAGGQSFPEFNPPAWLETPNPNDPNYSVDDYFGEQALSMLIDGNTFVDAFPYVWDPQVLTVINPTRVRVVAGPRYEILDDNGRVQRTLTPMNMLHGWWIKMPGELRGISPLEHFRRSLGGAIAAEEHAGRFFGQGASLSFGIEVPYAMDPTKLEGLRTQLRKKYAGLNNSHAIGVLSDGGKFVTGLAPTPEQAQMLDTRKFSVEDIARIYGVPPGMAGSQESGASSYSSAIEWRKQFRDDSVLKFTSKLERLHARLLNPPDATTKKQLRFNLDWVARTDLLVRYQAHSEGVRGGFLTPDEARAYEDKAPMPGGDKLYMQSQMAPIEDIGKVAPAPVPVRTEADPIDEARAAVVRSTEILSTMEAARAVADSGASVLDAIHELGKQIASRPEPVFNVPAAVVNVPASVINVPAPIVNVPAPIVNVTAPDVLVDTTPVAKVVAALAPKATRKTVRRDAAGRITSVTEEPMS